MNFIILHGLETTSNSHWFPWLKAQLEEQGHNVWVPDLPHPEQPNERIWTPFILRGSSFPFDENLIIIGWSAGAVEALHLLSQLSKPIHGVILLSAFINNLGWDNLSAMFEREFDFAKIKQNGGKMIFMHGSDDPHCPLKDAQYLAEQTEAEIKIINGAGHFSSHANPRFNKLPEIVPLVEKILRT